MYLHVATHLICSEFVSKTQLGDNLCEMCSGLTRQEVPSAFEKGRRRRRRRRRRMAVNAALVLNIFLYFEPTFYYAKELRC
jgi:hypothetical protein